MDRNRRTFLSLSALVPLISAVSLAAPERVYAQSQGQSQSSRPMNPFPQQIGPNTPVSDMSLPSTANPNPKPWLNENQREMRQDIKKLCDLADQLKQQVDKTDSTSVLSLNLFNNAKKIEDLAKHIKNLARGS
jgi:hypothetical protein